MSGMIQECSIDILSLFFIFFSLGTGIGFTIHFLDRMYHISETRYLKKVRNCKHEFKIVIKCKHCKLIRRLTDVEDRKITELFESIISNSSRDNA